MSTSVIFIIALFAFLIVSEVTSTVPFRRGMGDRKSLAAQEALRSQLQVMETTLTDIRDRLVSIEGILQQVE